MYTKKSLIVEFINKNRWLVLVVFLACFFSSVLNVFIPLSIGKFYELALNSGSAKGKLFDAIGVSLGTINEFFTFFITVIILKFIFTYGEHFFTGLINERFTRDLRKLLFDRQINQSVSTFNSRPSGLYLLRYSGDMTAIQRYISKGIIRFNGDIAFMIASLVLLYSISFLFASIIVAYIVAASFIMIVLGKYVRKRSLDRRNHRSKNLHFVSARWRAFTTLKAFNRETPENNSFEKRTDKLYKSGVRYQRLYGFVDALLPFFFFLMLATVLYAIYFERHYNLPHMGKEKIVVFVLLILYMQSSIKRLLHVNVLWANANVSFEKLLGILNLPVEERKRVEETLEINGSIRIENMNFSYDDALPVFTDFSESFDAQSTTLIRGRQGSGKSTLLKLILSLYKPTSGKLLMDNFDYENLIPFIIRKNAVLVSDEVPLIGTTVFKAITYSAREEKREKAARLLNKLNLQFETDVEKNLDFKLTDLAANISAGERKLLQIARAIFTGKKILLLDEPFQDLDDKQQINLAFLLNELKNKRTIIIAANQVPAALEFEKFISLNFKLKHEKSIDYFAAAHNGSADIMQKA